MSCRQEHGQSRPTRRASSCPFCPSPPGALTTAPARLVPFRLGRRRKLLRVPRGLHQFAHVRHRRQLCVVLQRARVESPERVLLLLQRLFARGRSGGRQDPGWRARVRGRSAWGAVRGFLCGWGRGDADAGVDTRRRPRYGKRRTCRRCYARYCTRTIRRIGWMRIAS